MENSKVRSLREYRVKAINQSGQGSINPLSPSAAPKPKLLDQVRQAIRTRHYSPRTEETYVGWIKRFIFFHNKRHPAEMAEAEIAQFLSTLAREFRVTASTQNQALNALLFLYREVLRKEIGYVNGVVRAKGPRRLPVVLTKEEVKRVLSGLNGSVDGHATLWGRVAAHGMLPLESQRYRLFSEPGRGAQWQRK